MKKVLKGLVTGAIMMAAFSEGAVAAQLGPASWNGLNVQSLLNTTAFPGAESSVSALDFTGEWMYTAIARESGNTNEVEEPADGIAGVGAANDGLTFTTANYGNWGQWQVVDFNVTNLFFEDSNGPFNVQLDAFTGTSDPGFKIYQLTMDSMLLTYLAHDLQLKVGDYIVGFNDNSLSDSDSDYDDIVVAMRQVPEPATLLLLGSGLLGLGLMRRRKN